MENSSTNNHSNYHMKRSTFVLFTFLFCINVTAQKLPNVQQAGLRVPANVKIDGKTTEWVEFKANNKACEIYYTIANDDENLYLAVQAKETGVIEKIFNSGLQLTVNTAGSKKTEGAPTITFPAHDDPKNKLYIDLDRKPVDSVKKASSERMAAIKFIRVANINGTANGAISVYNTEGIKAAVMLDDNLYLNYELSVPLKLLKITAASKK